MASFRADPVVKDPAVVVETTSDDADNSTYKVGVPGVAPVPGDPGHGRIVEQTRGDLR